MAVVTKYGQGYKDPAALQNARAVYAAAELAAITGNVSIAATDNANSVIYLGKMPSYAIPLSQSTVVHAALGGSCAYHLGLNVDNDIFAASQACASAGTKGALASVTTANLGKRVWELLGLTSDPGREYDLILTLSADAAAAGAVFVNFLYAK